MCTQEYQRELKICRKHTHLQDNRYVLKLNKALYGLVQAPRARMTEMNRTISKLGFINCKTDPCLSILKQEGKVRVILLVYAHDCIIAGEPQLVKEVIKKIKEVYKIKTLGPIRRYLGYEVERNKQGRLMISQEEYVENMTKKYQVDPINMKTPGRVSAIKREENDEKMQDNAEYQSLVGSLLYAAKDTRPDICNAVRNAHTDHSCVRREGHPWEARGVHREKWV